MSSPVNVQIVLLGPRIPVLIGSLISLNQPVQFRVCESLTPRGHLTVAAYQAGLSAVTAVLECSIDQGVSWFSIPATSTFYGTTTLTGDTPAISFVVIPQPSKGQYGYNHGDQHQYYPHGCRLPPFFTSAADFLFLLSQTPNAISSNEIIPHGHR